MSESSTPSASLSRSWARSTLIGRAKRALIWSEWPEKTGTRTQVPETFSPGMPRILRDSLRSFCSSSVSYEPSSTIEPAERHHVEGDRTLVDAGLREVHGTAVVGQPVRVGDDLRRLAVQLGDTGHTGAGDRLVGGDGEGLQARFVVQGRSTGMAAIVVQFGLAMMPLGRLSAASGLTSETTSGTSGSMRQAEELSITTAPWEATFSASAREVAPAGGEDDDLQARVVGGGGVLDRDRGAPEVDGGARRACGGEEPQLRDRELPLGQDLAQDCADLTGGTDDSDLHGETPLYVCAALVAVPSSLVGDVRGGPSRLHDAFVPAHLVQSIVRPADACRSRRRFCRRAAPGSQHLRRGPEGRRRERADVRRGGSP